MKNSTALEKSDVTYLNRLRGFSIFLVILGHLGLYWIITPYSSAFGAFLPAFFFISGAVSVGSFQRSSSVRSYFFKRLASLLVPIYFYVILIALISGFFFNYPINGNYFLLWAQLTPDASTMPFSLGQVWFLHTMVFITVFSALLFRVFGLNTRVFFMVIATCITLSIAAIFINIPDLLIFKNHNIFKPLIHFGFFVFGCFWTLNRKLFSNSACAILSILFILSSFALVVLSGISIDIAKHVYNPDGFYILLSYGFLFFLLSLKNISNIILAKFKYLDTILLFGGKHSYGIFIIHSFFIFFSEEVFGWLGVISNPKLAFMKVSFVILATCLAAVPFTAITTFLTSSINKKITKYL